MTEYSNDAQLHRRRINEDAALLRARIDHASQFLNPNHSAMEEARVSLSCCCCCCGVVEVVWAERMCEARGVVE